MSRKASVSLTAGSVAFAMAVGLGSIANADSSTSIGVSASVADACTFTANTVDLAFTEYTPGQTGQLAAQGSLEVNCSIASLGVTFSADDGSNGRNGGNNREMDNGGTGLLAYQLVAEGNFWGDGTIEAPLVKDLNQNLNTILIDGIVPGGQSPEGGNYADTVNVTMSF
ncbi:MAG: spore coat protein U domain-containing protein [Pseudomonadota bacterium]